MNEPMATATSTTSELSAAFRACRRAFASTALFTAVINVLSLTGSLFMLSVYDYAIPSQSKETLVGLVVFAGAMYAFYGVLEAVRAQVLSRIGATVADVAGPRIFEIAIALTRKGHRSDQLDPIRDLDLVRSFLSGVGPAALFDLPWMPFYLVICFLFHPLIGLAALGGGVIMVALTVMTERLTVAPQREMTAVGMRRQSLMDGARRSAETVVAMGMTHRLRDRWSASNAGFLWKAVRMADVANALGSSARVARMALQSGVLAVGAYLVIRQEASGGIMIASSILSARALAPVDAAIANWKGFVQCRQGWARLRQFESLAPAPDTYVDHHPPRHRMQVDGLTLTPPGTNRVVLHGLTFELEAGAGLGVIGPSGSGKSSLARAMVGVWEPARGAVRLDGVALDQWRPEWLGEQIGYLPQAVDLLDGTIFDNICRFNPEASSESVITAAIKAGVHDLIVRMPDGYLTNIGESGSNLSAGQRQRVALARALYNDPFLVVLDEPNSNLDSEGDDALTQAILSIRERGGVAVVVAHRPSALAGVNKVLMLADGVGKAFGDKDEVLRSVLNRSDGVASRPAPAVVVRAK